MTVNDWDKHMNINKRNKEALVLPGGEMKGNMGQQGRIGDIETAG